MDECLHPAGGAAHPSATRRRRGDTAAAAAPGGRILPGGPPRAVPRCRSGALERAPLRAPLHGPSRLPAPGRSVVKDLPAAAAPGTGPTAPCLDTDGRTHPLAARRSRLRAVHGRHPAGLDFPPPDPEHGTGPRPERLADERPPARPSGARMRAPALTGGGHPHPNPGDRENQRGHAGPVLRHSRAKGSRPARRMRRATASAPLALRARARRKRRSSHGHSPLRLEIVAAPISAAVFLSVAIRPPSSRRELRVGPACEPTLPMPCNRARRGPALDRAGRRGGPG
jgi:hypothetical protein